ncbi:helix-turn-helix domain-containing protein [Mucilaginibacter sp. cycad4]|uniref:winged helix-turn-helix transcriptional regulator n=1 Tax=Mucilaginibacter sp. cycad4 TaxID=3342096 RepID=UPI002AABC3B9|nr:helix-turn-helix domain-containing protein [Mucilaginibacter gossypii]WPU99164.1 helix-turn-helix domain-containing protein [Mucilaginibacter gossypii]
MSYTLDFLGDKWSFLIIRDIMLYGKSTYGEFLASEEKIATNILGDRLNMLEAQDFLTKRVSPDKKNKFIYNLTEKGISLVPMVMEMGLWGSQYNPPGLAQDIVDQLKADKVGTIAAIQEKLRSVLHKNE